jgi:hypothetical protein
MPAEDPREFSAGDVVTTFQFHDCADCGRKQLVRTVRRNDEPPQSQSGPTETEPS